MDSPIVTNVAFEAFACFEFESGRGWLVAEQVPRIELGSPHRRAPMPPLDRRLTQVRLSLGSVSIECRTPAHHEVQTIAWVTIIIYPIGAIIGTPPRPPSSPHATPAHRLRPSAHFW